VIECESLTKIMPKEGDSFYEVFKFERLHTTHLQSLTSLVCFYSGSDTLQLSSLKTVAVWSCPNMEFFSHRIQTRMGVTVSMDPEADDLPPSRDINTILKRISERKVKI